MAITVDQATIGQNSASGNDTTIALTTTAAVAAGATIIVAVGWWGGATDVDAADTAGNTYTLDHLSTGSFAQEAILSAYAPSGLASGSTITITYNTSTGGRSVAASSFNGIHTTARVGNVNFTRPTSTDAWSTGNIATTVDGELVYGAAHNDSNATTSTATSPSVETHDFQGDGITMTMAYRIEASPGTVTVAGTWATSSSESVIVGVAYKPAAGAVQTLAPSADSVDGNWTNQAGSATDLFDAINEATASDTDYIRSELGPANSPTRVKLASGGDPVSSSGHEINWRIAKDAAGGQTIGMIVKLYQGGGNSVGGGTLIASFTRSNVTNTFTDFAEALSAGEADSITNYGDLYLEFWANAT